jgi:ABC-2 type transport system ATP-binding protein
MLKVLMSSAISVQNLFVDYKTKRGELVTAVSDLSFEVGEGEIVGFLGPNGAGKSSTLKVLMGFVQQRAGTASLLGLPAGTPDSRKNVGYLPEVAMYYPFLTPFETLVMYGELQGLSGPWLKKEISELLEMLNIAHAAKKLNRSLSKGMLQRVGIAQALLGTPKLLILDEVTSGLDPVGRKELRTILRKKQAQGSTLFFSSHELAEVDMLCDRIIMIHKGSFVEERNIAELKDQLCHFAVTFTGNASMVGLTENLTALPQGGVVATFSEKAQLIEAVSRITQSKGTVQDIVSEQGSLEDYFVATVEAA